MKADFLPVFKSAGGKKNWQLRGAIASLIKKFKAVIPYLHRIRRSAHFRCLICL